MLLIFTNSKKHSWFLKYRNNCGPAEGGHLLLNFFLPKREFNYLLMKP